jgi:hypothetical protein
MHSRACRGVTLQQHAQFNERTADVDKCSGHASAAAAVPLRKAFQALHALSKLCYTCVNEKKTTSHFSLLKSQQRCMLQNR